MILRSVIKHVNEQNWTAIFIDFFIVVVGVVIGIQVANWNETRMGHKRAENYLSRIDANLQTDIDKFNDRIEFWNDVSEFGVSALNYTNTGDKKDLSHWQILLAFFQASQVAEFVVTRTTFDELTSAGELGLIVDIDIRQDISDYYSEVGNMAFSERPAYREHIRGLIPITIQFYIWENCYLTDSSLKQKMIACKSPISEQNAAELLSSITSNAKIAEQLRYWVSALHVSSIIGRWQRERANKLSALIQSELVL